MKKYPYQNLATVGIALVSGCAYSLYTSSQKTQFSLKNQSSQVLDQGERYTWNDFEKALVKDIGQDRLNRLQSIIPQKTKDYFERGLTHSQQQDFITLYASPQILYSHALSEQEKDSLDAFSVKQINERRKSLYLDSYPWFDFNKPTLSEKIHLWSLEQKLHSLPKSKVQNHQ